MARTNEFLVSTCDFAAFMDDKLVATGLCNLDTSISVDMQEQEVTGGRGSKLLYSYKFNRSLSVTLQTANFNLSYIAMNVGTKIVEGLADVYAIAECVDVIEGIGTLKNIPVGDVAVEIGDAIIMVTPVGQTIDLTKYGVTTGTVNATYRHNKMAKSITIDSDTAPQVFKLVLTAERHNSKKGRIGSLEVEIPSYQPNGSFEISFSAEGTTATNIDGKALAVESDRCQDGSSVYAYIRTYNDEDEVISGIAEIAASADKTTLSVSGAETAQISVIGLKGAMYANIELDAAACRFTADASGNASVDAAGVVTPVQTGDAKITVAYGDVEDEIEFTIEA